MGLLLMQAMHCTKEMEQLPTAAKPSNKLQPLVKQNALTKQKILFLGFITLFTRQVAF